MIIEEFIWTPEDYEPSAFYINDLIILKLKTPLIQNRFVKPVILPNRSLVSNVSIDNCVVSGWGALRFSKFCHTVQKKEVCTQ